MSTGSDWAKATKLRAAQIVHETDIKQTAPKGVEIAKALSSGDTSLAQLATEDHPYAKRHAEPTRPPWLINDQGGPFKQDWQFRAGTQPTDAQMGEVVIENTDPIAIFLEDGTRTMVKRPIKDVIPQLLEPYRNQYIAEAFARKIEV